MNARSTPCDRRFGSPIGARCSSPANPRSSPGLTLNFGGPQRICRAWLKTIPARPWIGCTVPQFCTSRFRGFSSPHLFGILDQAHSCTAHHAPPLGTGRETKPHRQIQHNHIYAKICKRLYLSLERPAQGSCISLDRPQRAFLGRSSA